MNKGLHWFTNLNRIDNFKILNFTLRFRGWETNYSPLILPFGSTPRRRQRWKISNSNIQYPHPSQQGNRGTVFFMGDVVLAVDDLKTYFRVKEGLAKAVDGVSFRIHRGETLGLVGESGCGKTVSSLSILKLLEMPPAEFHAGKIHFEGQNLLTFTEQQMRSIRGKSISMIFQEPMTSLNPMLSIGYQVGEVLINHEHLTVRQARTRAVELLELVGIPSPQKRATEYPHQTEKRVVAGKATPFFII